MANNIIGSIVANDLLPITLRQAGSISFGPLNLPIGFTQLMIVFDLRQVSTLTASLNATLELSPDSGANWTPGGSSGLSLPQSGYVLNGGVLTRSVDDPDGPGAPVRIFGTRFRLTQANLSTRQIRGTLSADESLISGVTFVGF